MNFKITKLFVEYQEQPLGLDETRNPEKRLCPAGLEAVVAL